MVTVESSPFQRRLGLVPDHCEVRECLRQHDVHVTNSHHPDVVEDCLMHAADSVADALDPGMDVLVVPDALNTLLVRAD